MLRRIDHELIILVREYRRLTQAELSRRTGLHQGTISRIESGQVGLDTSQIASIATALDMPESFFSFTGFDRRSLPLTLYRKRKLQVKEEKSVAAQINIQLMALRRLLNSFEFTIPRVRAVDIEEYNGSFRRAAEELKVQWNLKQDLPVPNLTSAIEKAGIFVIPTNLKSAKVDGLSIVERDIPPLIFVNSDLAGDRLRWTLCHELGHILFHHHVPLPGKRDLDDEADTFASEFLLPTEAFRRQFTGRKVDIQRLGELKLHWRVSMSAILRKAKGIGKVTETTYTSIFRQMSAMGIRKNEPYPIPKESTQMINELFRLHVEDLGYSLDELSTLVGLSVNDIHRVFPGVVKGASLRIIG